LSERLLALYEIYEPALEIGFAALTFADFFWKNGALHIAARNRCMSCYWTLFPSVTCFTTMGLMILAFEQRIDYPQGIRNR
jgi:hypothetical protein